MTIKRAFILVVGRRGLLFDIGVEPHQPLHKKQAANQNDYVSDQNQQPEVHGFPFENQFTEHAKWNHPFRIKPILNAHKAKNRPIIAVEYDRMMTVHLGRRGGANGSLCSCQK